MSTSTVPPSSGPRWRRWVARVRPPSATQDDAAAQAHDLDRELVMGLSTKRIPTLTQLRSLGQVVTPSERRWLTIFASTGLVALVGLIISLVLGHVTQAAQSGGTLTEGIVGGPQFINPVLARPDTADSELVSLTFRGLMRVNRDLRIVPDLAKTVVPSDDRKTYTVTLPSGLRWSDGQTLTVDDIVFTYQTLSDAQYKSPWTSNLRGITVEKKDSRTVLFHVSNPTPGFLNILTLGLIPQHAWGDQTGSTFPLAELNLKPIGNGPYKFSSLTKDHSGLMKSLTLIKNKDYAHALPFIDRLVLKFYPDQVTAVQAVESGAVDTLGGLSTDDVATLRKRRQVTNTPIAQLTGVFFSQRTNPALKTIDVRQALEQSVNRADLVSSTLHGQAKVAFSPIPPGFIGYNAQLKRGTGNLDQAKALLDNAGWKVTASGVRQKGSQQLTFVLTTADEPALTDLAAALVKTWTALGAHVEVKTVDPSRIAADVISGRQYEALLFGQRFSADGDLYPYWDSSQQRDPGFALAIFFNKNLDKDIEEGRTTTDLATREKDYVDFQNIFADQVPAIIIDQAVYAYAHPKNLRGLNDQHLIGPANRFDDVASWYLRTRLTWVGKKK